MVEGQFYPDDINLQDSHLITVDLFVQLLEDGHYRYEFPHHIRRADRKILFPSTNGPEGPKLIHAFVIRLAATFTTSNRNRKDSKYIFRVTEYVEVMSVLSILDACAAGEATKMIFTSIISRERSKNINAANEWSDHFALFPGLESLRLTFAAHLENELVTVKLEEISPNKKFTNTGGTESYIKRERSLEADSEQDMPKPKRSRRGKRRNRGFLMALPPVDPFT